MRAAVFIFCVTILPIDERTRTVVSGGFLNCVAKWCQWSKKSYFMMCTLN